MPIILLLPYKLKSLFTILLLSFLIISCSEPEPEKKNKSSRDLDQIREAGKLKALTTYSGTSYFLYRGRPMGFEYEMLKKFAEYIGVEPEIHITGNIDSLIHDLNHDKFDLVAHGLTVTSERKKQVLFSDYLYLTHQVLVQKKPEGWRRMSRSKLQSMMINDAIQLIGDTVSVRQNSSYLHRLKNLSREIGGKIHIDTLPGNLSTDEIIKMVVDGEIKYTLADNNIAAINQSYYPELDIDVPVSFSQRIAWAVKPGSENLAGALNKWLDSIKQHTEYYVIYNKYFKNSYSFRKRVESEFYSLNNQKISQYDSLIKKNASEAGIDWRLLASMIYQESGFKPNVSSWADATGLMQLMPETAAELGVKDITNPVENISAGTRYLVNMWNRFDDVTDSLQRMKLAMAAYNCGFGHMEDARALAEVNEMDPDKWDGNVEEMIMKLSYPTHYNHEVVKFGYVRGIEPYTYVDQIYRRYSHYKKFIN
jgi:membrane-bound lytic murein transglycosylase F